MSRNWFAVHAHNRRGGSHACKKKALSRRSCRGVWEHDEDDYWDDGEDAWEEEDEDDQYRDGGDGDLEEERYTAKRSFAGHKDGQGTTGMYHRWRKGKAGRRCLD